MDPRDRADAMLARARARHGHVVTPEDVSSPMDAMNTMQIPRAVVQAADDRDAEPEITTSIPGPAARARAEAAESSGASETFGASAASEASAAAEAAEPDPSTDPPTGPLPALAAETVTTYVHPAAARQADPPPEPRQMDGLIPTIQEPPGRRSSLSRRLDGETD